MNFFHWRGFVYRLDGGLLTRAVAVDSHQAVYAITWMPPNTFFRASRSASALEPPPPAGRHRRASADTHSPAVRVLKIPFARIIAPDCLDSDRETQSEFFPMINANVPPADRGCLIQAAQSSVEGLLLIIISDGTAFIYRTEARLWEPPLILGNKHLQASHLISLGGSGLLLQYVQRGTQPLFSVLNIEQRIAQPPTQLAALPRSHCLATFLSEHDRRLHAIIDRWPRCSREWWSLKVDALQGSVVRECRQHACQPIDLQYSEFIPVGNRWVLGIRGRRWHYLDSTLIPHEQPARTTGDSALVIDKFNGTVTTVADKSNPPADQLGSSPSFYVPIPATQKVTLELPAVLVVESALITLRVWGGSLSRLPADIDEIWGFLSKKCRLSETAVRRIMSFALT